MNLGWEEHFHRIVVPAWQAYLSAENRLSAAIEAGQEEEAEHARFAALREGGAAVLFLHHFADLIAAERPERLPPHVTGLAEVRAWVASACRVLRSDTPSNDVALLGDVADAIKHSQLTKRVVERDVSARDAVMVIATDYGFLPFGEGNFGGAEQVVVLARSSPRALSAVLQNAIDAWRTVMGWPLPQIGQP